MTINTMEIVNVFSSRGTAVSDEMYGIVPASGTVRLASACIVPKLGAASCATMEAKVQKALKSEFTSGLCF